MFTPLFLCFESYYFFQLKQNKTPANQCDVDFFFFSPDVRNNSNINGKI